MVVVFDAEMWRGDVREDFTRRSGSESGSWARFLRFLRALPFSVKGFMPPLGAEGPGGGEGWRGGRFVGGRPFWS